MTAPLAETGTHESQFPKAGRFHSSLAGSRTLLLISEDQQLHKRLRSVANAIGNLVVRAGGPTGSVAILRVTRPMAVLLDLDLPAHAAWDTAELLLKEPSCPPVILLTGRTEQFDLRTAMRAGSLASKSESPLRLLELVQEALETPESNQTERNAIQRVLLGSLRPSGWEEPITPAYRFWGINE